MSAATPRRDPAIVLRTRIMGEADLAVVLLGATSGKLTAAARGARRSAKRFPSGLPVGACGVIEWAPGRGTGLARLLGFWPNGDTARLGRDPLALGSAAYACELTDELLWEHEPVPVVFEALWGTLGALREHEPDPLWLRWLELRLLAALGHTPALGHCASCGRQLGLEVSGFDLQRGGALCSQHAAGATPLDAEAARALEGLAGADAPTAWTALGAAPRRAVRNVLQEALRPHLRRPLASVEFFRKLAGAASGPSRRLW